MAHPDIRWEWEGPLDTAADPGERFRRLAEGQLEHAYHLAGLLLGDATEAQDATQDALMRAWRAFGSLRDEVDFPAWLDRILVNACRDRLRRRRVIRLLPLASGAEPVAGDPFASILERDEALRMMARLTTDERSVIVLHYWADLALTDVAERLGWPVGTVKSRLHRALGRLAGAHPTPGRHGDS